MSVATAIIVCPYTGKHMKIFVGGSIGFIAKLVDEFTKIFPSALGPSHFFFSIFYFFQYSILLPLIAFCFKFGRCHRHLNFIQLFVDVILECYKKSKINSLYLCKQRLIMADERSESPRDNFGKFINEFQLETKTLIRKFERVLIKLYKQNVSLLYIYIYIYIYIHDL